MTSELALVLALLAAAVAMFVIGRPRMDVVAILMLVLLPVFGLVTLPEALAGFADPNIVLIAALFVIGEGLVRTGVAQRMGDLMVRHAGTSETRLVVLLMALAAGLGSIMSSTGVVAIFIPIVLRMARLTGANPARLMMPLSVAALISGMMTLVATAPNLVVSGELARQGHAGFGFFAFTPFGLPMLALAIPYMLLARRWLGRTEAPAAPDGLPHAADWIARYALAGREARLRIAPGSPWAGRRLDTLGLCGAEGLNILAIAREKRIESPLAGRFGLHLAATYDRKFLRPQAETVLEAGDVLLIDMAGGAEALDRFAAAAGLERLPLDPASLRDIRQAIGMAEVVVPADSPLVGQTVVSARLRSTTGLTLMGLRRGRQPLEGPVTGEPIRAGDTLLVTASWPEIARLGERRRELVLLTLPAEAAEVPPAARRAPFALLALAVTVALMVTGLVPNVIAALVGCLMMGATRCLDMEQAYRAIHWPSLVLIVGMMPFSAALQATGGVDLAARGLLALVGDVAPRLALAVLFLVTAGLGLFISNTATAVLMAPVALQLAADLGAAPHPFAMTVALAASAAFVTPVSSPVNTLVVGPGNYAFVDFVKVGLPLALIALALTVALVPVVLPL